MADKVQLTLESQIPEMDALVKKKIFEKKEAKKILKKRRYHEYQFEKTDVSPLDFFRAIKYEKILNKRLIQNKKKLNIQKTDYNDFHFIRRIIVLFKKCLMKFDKDEKIWLEFFNFLIQNNCNSILNKEIGKCLTKHPTNILFWKIAAYNEFENNLNSLSARNLFQTCIRLNAKNLNSYLEYFIFEIKFAEKITERRNFVEKKEDKLKLVNDVITQDTNQEKDINQDEIKTLKIPEFIWQDSLKKLGLTTETDVIDYHFSFLESLETYTSDILDSTNLENKIVAAILAIRNDTDTKVKIILTKIKKFKNHQNELPQYIKEEFERFRKENPDKNSINFFIYSVLNYFNENIKNLPLIDTIFEEFKSYITLDNLKQNHQSNSNLKLLSLLSSDNFIEKNVINTSELKNMCFELIIPMLEREETENLNQVFVILGNIKSSLQVNVIEEITKIVLPRNVRVGSLEVYIKNVLKLVGEEITYYLSPEKGVKYILDLSAQVEAIKGIEYEVYKFLYKQLLALIVDKIIQVGEDSDSKSYYAEAVEVLKQKMKKKLIGFQQLYQEIVKEKKVGENETNLLKWIIL